MLHTTVEKRARFRQLHEQGCFVLPNPWDIGSARLFQHLGFDALASTSSGYAWTQGRPDYKVTLEDVLSHLSDVSQAVDAPVNADFESGFAADLEGLAANIVRAVDTGIAGLSIEDRNVDTIDTLYDLPVALERLRIARAAIDGTGQDVILVARTEGLLIGGTLVDAIDRCVALADAGADCIYAPGIGMPGLGSRDDIVTLVRAVAPLPVNLLVWQPDAEVTEFADLGVRRISVGGALSLVGWGATMTAAKTLKDGSFGGLSGAMEGRDLNAIFSAGSNSQD